MSLQPHRWVSDRKTPHYLLERLRPVPGPLCLETDLGGYRLQSRLGILNVCGNRSHDRDRGFSDLAASALDSQVPSNPCRCSEQSDSIGLEFAASRLALSKLTSSSARPLLIGDVAAADLIHLRESRAV